MTILIHFKGNKTFGLFESSGANYKATVVSCNKTTIRLNTEDGDIVEASYRSDGQVLKAGSTVVFSGSGQVLEFEQVKQKAERQTGRSGCSAEQARKGAPNGLGY